MATVFFNGTSVGTYSDKYGHFELDISRHKPMPITVSALGYNSTIVTNYFTGIPQTIYLTPKVFELNEVIIGERKKGKTSSRVNNLKIFKREFLGESSNALKCDIINENDIKLENEKGILKVFASKPIMIKNNTLSYTITYFLDKFEFDLAEKSLLILGNIIFQDDSYLLDNSQKLKVEKERRNAFYGSRMHFMRSLWANDLKPAGYSIRNTENKVLDYNSIVNQSISTEKDKSQKCLDHNGNILITYFPKFGKTWIELTNKNVFFDKFGYFDPASIKWSGDMAKKRIADLLPYDYSENPQSTIDESSQDSVTYIEKVYIHTDRTYYYPGDDIWFKAYLINASDKLLTNHSNNLHVDLISPDAKVISSHIIRLADGLGNGDFQLKGDIATGKYKLRAYTNYMRNFSDELFFCKEIFVLNTSSVMDNPSKDIKIIKNITEINFFPEGGSLVENVSSIIALKAINANGKGCNIRGNVYSSNNELITSFNSTHLGMGSFILKPLSGLRYYAITTDSLGVQTRTELPKSIPWGVNFSVTSNQKNELLITTKTNAATLPLVLDHNLVLSISARKELIKTISFKIKSFLNSFILSTDDLPEGILTISLSTLDSLPLSERLIFNHQYKDIEIMMQVDNQYYKQREAVSLKLSLKGDSSLHHEGNISLAVVEKNLIDSSSKSPGSISSWFLLESDIRGNIEKPSYYFDSSNLNRFKDLDLLLRTQGWRDFAWKYYPTSFPAEDGFSISGKIRKNFVNKAIEDSKVNIGLFENIKTTATTVSCDSAGRFKLSGIDFSGEARLIVSAIGKDNHLKGLLVLDSMKYSPARIPSDLSSQEFEMKQENLALLKQDFEISEAIRKKYKLSDTINLGEVRIIASKSKSLQTIKIENSRAGYGTPDVELVITPQMESIRNPIEVIRGHIAGVEVSGMFPDYSIRIRGNHSFNSNTYPLVLVDGFSTSFEDLISMPLYFIDRIDVLKSGGSTAIYGMQGANGVINIITKTIDRVSTYLPVNYSANIKIFGYNSPRVFYSPQYDSKNDHKYSPDLRSTLLWEPNLTLSDDNEISVNYYNADKTSKIQVIAEGITTNGIPITGQITYEVK